MRDKLKIIADNRNALLLAEIAAWLHDDFKCTDQQIKKYVINAPDFSGRQDTGDCIPDIEITLLDTRLSFALAKNRKRDDFVEGYLDRCHRTAHIEKEDGDNQQIYPAYLSTPFGFEKTRIPENLTNMLLNTIPWSLISNPITDRTNLQKQLKHLFSQVGGDTRRSGNEITLWEWSHTVGVLYKTALVGACFQKEQSINFTEARNLRWRLLSVRTNGLAYVTNVSRLPDVKARQSTLNNAFDKVQVLLEQTYPLATEVYRDENGSLYVVPNVRDLLSLENATGQALLDCILKQFDVDGEIIPEVVLDETPWWGQDPDRKGNDKIPPIGKLLSLTTVLKSDANLIEKAWEGTYSEVCSVCGLRPCVSRQTNYCQICRQRRQGRVTEWMNAQNTTIWLDEVADSTGRLAIIIGTFDLTDWLSGQFVETMLVKAPTSTNGSGTRVTKTPSFARLRRVWETTRSFWHESQSIANHALADSRRRLTIQLANSPDLKEGQTYELDLLGQTRMSVLWDGSYLISIDNLSYTAIQLNIPISKLRNPADAALEVGAWLDKNKENEQGRKRVLRLISDDEKNTQFDIQIADVDYQDTAYSTTIPILSEPRTFMTLVPADKALDVTRAIKEKYEREMGKVRNRLPLHLGVVYFHRRTPLRAALEAGRRMLDRKQGGRDAGEQGEKWRVMVKPEKRARPPSDAAYLATDTQQFDEYYAVELEGLGDRKNLTWYVPAVMSDGSTEDNWYPYIFLETNGDDRKVDGKRAFKGLRPTTTGQSETCWLVHAGDLEAEDKVYFTPATFDFEWLDTTGRRFEIAYDDEGQRRDRLRRPYLLDEVQVLKGAWQVIGGKEGLTNNQIYALRDLIESKRVEWYATPTASCLDKTYHQFCREAILNAEWPQAGREKLLNPWPIALQPNGAPDHPTERLIDHLTNWAVNGLLTDVIELYMSIMKEKPERSQAKKETTDEQ